jgi:alanine racemase
MESYLTAEVSAEAVSHNLRLLRQRIGPRPRMCAVVKADCYGHGVETLLPVIAEHADMLAVATPEEAINLRRLRYYRPIITFFSACAYNDGNDRLEALAELVANNVTITVVAIDEVAFVAAAARRAGGIANIHVKVDSGMGRSGVMPEGVQALVDAIQADGHLFLAGMYTHFATADEIDKTYALQQLNTFMEAATSCGIVRGLTLHAANSAAIIDLPQSHLDMVRPGIAIYGYQPSDDMHTSPALKPAMRVWGRLMQVKTVPAGSKVGYGLTHTFDRDARVGLVPIGYGDGYPRSLSNRATMRIRGRNVLVCGRVSMDQCIIDLSSLPDAQVGDQVEIISADPMDQHSVEELARAAGMIPYELTCRLGRRVKRQLVPTFETIRPARLVARSASPVSV